jgi:WD40 repeat protein
MEVMMNNNLGDFRQFGLSPQLALAKRLRERAQFLLSQDSSGEGTQRAAWLNQRAETLELHPVYRFPLRGNFRTEDIVQSFGFEDPVFAVAISPDGSKIAAGGKCGELRVISRVPTDESPWCECILKYQADGAIVTLSFSTDSQYVVCGGFDGIVRIISLDRLDMFGRPLVVASFAQHDCATAVKFSADGRYLAIASGWSTKGRVRVVRLAEEVGAVSEIIFDEAVGGATPAIAFHPDCEHIAIAGTYTRVLSLVAKEFDGDKMRLKPLLALPDTAKAICFSPAGDQLALGGGIRIGEGARVRIYQLHSNTELPEMATWEASLLAWYRTDRLIRSIALSPMGELIAVALESPLFSGPHEILLLGINSASKGIGYYGFDEYGLCTADRPVRTLSFSNDGSLIAVGGDHAIVWLFGLNSRNQRWYEQSI